MVMVRNFNFFFVSRANKRRNKQIDVIEEIDEIIKKNFFSIAQFRNKDIFEGEDFQDR